MTPFDEALAIIIDSAWNLPQEEQPLADCLGRVLAQDVCADMDMPPFNKSAMDGYACRHVDLPGPLSVLEVIAAGQVPTQVVGTGQCSKIMTGAPMPAGADCVIMVEFTEEVNADSIRFTEEKTNNNFCMQGEDVKTGDVVLRAGTKLLPQHLPILAMVGCATPCVIRAPRVGIMATGDELVPVDATPSAAQIRNSNSFQMEAQASALACVVTNYGIIPDDKDTHTDVLTRAIAENDVVLSTGGVSMGDFDLVPDLLAAQGLELLIRKIAMQPGKPIVFALGEEKACFGLSGNPMSSFIQFEFFVRAFLLALQGASTAACTVTLPLGETLTRKKGARMGWVPVSIQDGCTVGKVELHGSAHIGSMACADGFIAFPVGVTTLEKGDSISVRLIR